MSKGDEISTYPKGDFIRLDLKRLHGDCNPSSN